MVCMTIIKVRFQIFCISISCELSSPAKSGIDGRISSSVTGAAVGCGAEVSFGSAGAGVRLMVVLQSSSKLFRTLATRFHLDI